MDMARGKRGAILDQKTDVQRVQAVDVLFGTDCVEHAPFGVRTYRIRQRRLHEDAIMDLAVVQAGETN